MSKNTDIILPSLDDDSSSVSVWNFALFIDGVLEALIFSAVVLTAFVHAQGLVSEHEKQLFVPVELSVNVISIPSRPDNSKHS
tara:strand:+ start:342 stop:590 length:249 start_codon:yes stop_codon:yes gene_type:complete